VALGLIWALALIGATQPLSHWLRRAAVIGWLDRSTGLIFVLFAARLALSRR
jgi:threonine/homoserine/homoserine lactone efflux protein